MESFILTDKRWGRKKITEDELRVLLCPSDSEDGFDDSDEDPTVDYKTLVSQHRNVLHISDSEEHETEEGEMTSGHQIQEKLDLLKTTSIRDKNVRDDFEDVQNLSVTAVPSTSTDSCVTEKVTRKSKISDKKTKVLWKQKNIDFGNYDFKGDVNLPNSILDMSTSYQFFNYFFTDELLTKIAEETNLYSSQIDPNKPMNFSMYDIQKFLGICIISSLAPPTNIRDLWNEVLGTDMVKETMSQKNFEKIRSCLHFNDNSKQPKSDSPNYDKLYKLRPVFDHINKKFLSVPMSERLAIDEQMCATKTRHHMKVYMKDKPHKWGYKLYVLCGDMGFAYKIEIYSGQENDPRFRKPEEPDLGASGNVVVRLSREIPRNVNHKLYFDRYYTSLPLATYLYKQGIPCIGTIQRNRIPNCKFPSDQDLKKKPRGFSEEYATHMDAVDIAAVIFKDNSNVALLSTFVGEMPKSEMKRFDRKKREHVNLPCPAIVSVYNRHMGNVDLLDSNIGRFHIKMKSKKWYFRIFYHLVDLVVVNAWILHRQMCAQKGENAMNQKAFRLDLAQTLCKLGPQTVRRGRPRSSDPIEEVKKNLKALLFLQETCV